MPGGSAGALCICEPSPPCLRNRESVAHARAGGRCRSPRPICSVRTVCRGREYCLFFCLRHARGSRQSGGTCVPCAVYGQGSRDGRARRDLADVARRLWYNARNGCPCEAASRPPPWKRERAPTLGLTSVGADYLGDPLGEARSPVVGLFAQKAPDAQQLQGDGYTMLG